MIQRLIANMTDDPAGTYATILPYVLGVAMGVILLHFVASLVLRPTAPRRTAKWNLWEKLIYTVTLLALGVLAVTSFYSVLAMGHMLGWMLYVHLLGAGAFVVLLLLVALTWAHASRFSGPKSAASDTGTAGASIGTSAVPRFGWLAKVSFWVMLAAGVATAGTMLVSMLPLLDTVAMQNMIALHRYAGLVLVVAVIFHLYGVWLGKLGLR
jgi:hypothetical protein